ncbi:permease of the drug/metabolite transporter (DMT) superfamily [Sulfurospirillum diekertiae]|uniref:Permease of the drug/metabolite transporter (DMT) superfamily n=1 Tax=Sulfurospirillum diekertiae TaxID=1854492 RepID=A0A290H9Q4_9BACT|nr:DMT family transporter [Sulfurospirillum diekertiae]ATB68292.1 permease of the drug/metabolite transporter (DMT) superfamily [Sulfurospirillum diekertiae]
MISNKFKELGADFLLLMVAVAWGSTFFVVQAAVNETPVYTFLFWRFSLAGLLMALISFKQIRYLNFKVLKAGALLGLFMFLGYAFQTFALTYTYSSTVGFITGLSVIVVPFVTYLIFKQKASMFSTLGAIIASVGLYFLTLNNELGLSLGEFYAFVCAMMFALHIVFTGHLSRQHNIYLLVMIQFLTVGICSFIGGFMMEDSIMPPNTNRLFVDAIAITVIFATIFAFWVQTAMQRFTTAAKTAIIFTMEPVSAGIFGYFFANELLTFPQICGAVMILGGMLTAELGSYYMEQYRRRNNAI